MASISCSIVGLLDSCDRNSPEFALLMHDLLVDNSDLPFDNHEVNTVQRNIVSNINSCIDVASTRYNGLVLLDKILSRCSKDILSKHGLFWITKSIELLEDAHSTIQELTLACKVLGYLFEHGKGIPELHQVIFKNNIKRLLLLVNELLKNRECGAIYYLTAIMLYHYPEVCESSQELIKKIILQQIDSTQENLINASAKCYVLLSKATERSFKPPSTKLMYTRWTYNQVLLCNNLHAIMDELFLGVIELKTVDIWDHLDLPSISEDNVIQYYNEQKQRFLNLCIYLSSMLCGYDAQNSVVPQDILEVLCRGLAITPLNLKNKASVKEQMLYIMLPKLHIGLLTVLNAFIVGFAKELIPFGKTILNLLQQTLKWTSTCLENHLTFSSSKSFRNIRISMYKCLSSWLINAGSLSGIETIASECITFIMKDITPERDCILLTTQKPQRCSKRSIKRFKDSQYENSQILNKQVTATNGSLDADLCKEALIVLQNILYSGGVLLKQGFYKNVQNTVIPLLHNFYLDHSAQDFYKNHNKCRLELFKVLRALQMNPHTTLMYPISYYLEISHMAAYDVDINIVQEARLALAELEKIIHPTAPTLQLPRQSEPHNQFLPENQVEEPVTETATASLSLNEKDGMEQELSQEADAYKSPCKRPKITMPECIELIEVINDKTNLSEPQTDKNTHEIARNLSEQYEAHTHRDNQQSLPNNYKFTNANTEVGTECEPVAHIITEDREQWKQPEDPSPENKKDEMLGKSFPITEEVQKRISKIEAQKERREELDADVSKMCNMFIDVSSDTSEPD